MTTAISSYRQTTSFTCALSSYMVARKELCGTEPCRGQELTIWFSVLPWYLTPLRKPLSEFVGTPPCCLAKHIQVNDRDLEAQLLMYCKNLSAMDKRKGLMGALCGFHDWFAGVFMGLKPRGQKIDRLQTADDILAIVNQSPSVRLLQVTTFHGGMVHFVMIRGSETGGASVMDPWFGINTAYTADEFRRDFGPKVFGYAIRISLRHDDGN